MALPAHTDLAALKPLLGVRLEEFVSRYGLTQQVKAGVSYGQLAELTVVRSEAAGGRPVQFYFRDGKLFLVYIERPGTGMDRDALKAGRSGALTRLPSPVNKQSGLYVYPEEGIAFSSSVDETDYVEVFTPTTIEGYRATLYKEPGKFVL